MSSLARTIRRASARRTGEGLDRVLRSKTERRMDGAKADRDYGQMIEGSIKGRPLGAKCFDFANRISPKLIVVHFRHPTKKRTAARVCQAAYAQVA